MGRRPAAAIKRRPLGNGTRIEMLRRPAVPVGVRYQGRFDSPIATVRQPTRFLFTTSVMRVLGEPVCTARSVCAVAVI